MGRIVAQIFQSLDGYYAGPNGEFIPPEWSSDMQRWSLDAMAESEGFIYGRVNFEFNRDFWMQAETDPNSAAAGVSYAGQMNAKPKTVFSRTLVGDPGWNGTVAQGDLPGVVERLQESSDKDWFLFGSGTLFQSFAALDLVDEYRLLIVPHLYGDGKRLFGPALPERRLKLIETFPMDTGAVLLRYHRA